MIEGLVTKARHRVALKGLGDYVTLHPVGDVHWDIDACERDRFDADCKCMKSSHNPLYIGMGDYLDFASWSDRKKITNSGLHDNSIERIDKMHRDDLRAFGKKVGFMRGRCIGLLDGNHNWVDERGCSGAERLSDMLSCKYLGWISYIKLSLECTGGITTVDIVVCHGKGGGKLAGTSINQVSDLTKIFPAADIYIFGHNHDRGGWPTSTLHASVSAYDPEGFTLKERTQWFCRSGSYMRGYAVGSGGFVSSKLMRPCSLGKITIRIGMERKSTWKGSKRLKSSTSPTIKVEA